MQILKDLCIETGPPEHLAFVLKKFYEHNTTYYFCFVYEVIEGEMLYVETLFDFSTDKLYQQIKKKYSHNNRFQERTMEGFLNWYYKINPDANGGITFQNLLSIAKKFGQ